MSQGTITDKAGRWEKENRDFWTTDPGWTTISTVSPSGHASRTCRVKGYHPEWTLSQEELGKPIEIESLGRIRLDSGDVLVITMPYCSEDERIKLKAFCDRAFPNNEVLVAKPAVEFSVIRQGEQTTNKASTSLADFELMKQMAEML